MIHRIFGRAGSGKSEYIYETLKKAHSDNKKCILLIPEQQSISAERELCSRLGSKYNLTTEILNFERLPDIVFRENGGITLSRADSKTLSLFTAMACENAKESLTTYESSAFDKDFIKKVSETIERMENSDVTPKQLANAASLSQMENSSFKEKLYDIAQIYHEYNELLKKGYADSAGIQKKLLESLEEKNFFEGKTVFIDGYYNFTKAQYPIIRKIFEGAEDTYITILYDKNEKSEIFDINKATIELIDSMGKCAPDVICGNERKRTPALSYLEKNLFSHKGVSEIPPNDGSISTVLCKTPFEECDYVAREIIRLVKSGYRYKDICVAVRNDDRFDGYLDAALNRYGISFYSASKDKLSSNEISSLVLSLLEISFTDWSTASVVRYANSSFSPLTPKEADLLSIYAETWRIRGKRWYNGEAWLMNPSGYKTSFSKREESMLKIVNTAREKLLFALEAYTTDLKSKNLTIEKGVRAIYNHLIHIKADVALERKANQLLEQGKDEEADRISALWDGIMSILSTLYENAGKVKVNAKRLYDLCRLMMDEYEIGVLPASSDGVEIGNASIMRPSECKVMICMGMNDEVFPASPSSSGLFSTAEKEFLRQAGIESETLPDEFVKNEFLLFYNLCAAPTDKLILTCSENSSAGDKERISVFSDNIIRTFGKECFSTYVQPSIKRKIPSIKKNVDFDTFSESVLLTPSEPKVLELSSSKIETYLKCPFSYYCNYILALKNFEAATFNPADTGTYFHSIVEKFTKSLFETGSFKGKTPEEIKAFAKEEQEKYMENIFHGINGERENYSFDQHEKVILPLLQNINDEFAAGGFVPLVFEEKTESHYDVTEKTKAHMKGFADRIDILEKDGVKYVRIIDYKTGKRALSESDVKNGFEMQMLTYLFSACKNDEVPAGVLYFMCGMPGKNDKEFQRNGIMLDDENVKSSMSFLSDNGYFSSKSFKSAEVFKELKTAVAENISAVGKCIIDGKMDINPTSHNGKSPCTYCSARLYCRKKLTED